MLRGRLEILLQLFNVDVQSLVYLLLFLHK